MAGTRVASSTGPPKSPTTNKKTSTARQLRIKANRILESRKNVNELADILEMFNEQTKNYTSLLLTVEMIFTNLLRRGDMHHPESKKIQSRSPESIYLSWLRSNYNKAFSCALACMKKGEESSRAQALVTCVKLLAEESAHPLAKPLGVVHFAAYRLLSILEVFLDQEQPQPSLIARFSEYAEYRDVQQNALKLMCYLANQNGLTPNVKYQEENAHHPFPAVRRAFRPNPSRPPNDVFIRNYLELFDALMKPGIPVGYRSPAHIKEDKYLCQAEGVVTPPSFDPVKTRVFANCSWHHCQKWPLLDTEGNHRRALVLLVDRLMPYLTKPELATDMLCESLDCGSAISMIALRGMLELVTKHGITYPDIYDRLYNMFEPAMFETRSKKRLIHLTDVFLSSTRLSATLVAAFAKRLSRLALLASPEDAKDLLQLISSMVQRHPSLKKMLCHDQPAIMPKDPYVMEETTTIGSSAVTSSLWEISALKQHFNPEVSAAATKLIASATAGAPPPDLHPSYSDYEQFDMECKKRFKTIEMNFITLNNSYYTDPNERLDIMWAKTKILPPPCD